MSNQLFPVTVYPSQLPQFENAAVIIAAKIQLLSGKKKLLSVLIFCLIKSVPSFLNCDFPY